jgi:hypothetical protein
MRVICVAGARPNFMKVSPILRALRAAGHKSTLVHTGQHYDAQMSGQFFADLELPEPDFNLEVGSAGHTEQTARIMERFEPVVRQIRPDWVLVVGDVNSTMACALVTAHPGPRRRSSRTSRPDCGATFGGLNPSSRIEVASHFVTGCAPKPSQGARGRCSSATSD